MKIPSTTAVRSVTVAAVAAAAALGAAATASAGPMDVTFVTDLESHGIYFDAPDWAVYQAKYVCGELDKGRSYPSIHQEGLAQSSLSSDEITYFIERAVTTYCPVNLLIVP